MCNKGGGGAFSIRQIKDMHTLYFVGKQNHMSQWWTFWHPRIWSKNLLKHNFGQLPQTFVLWLLSRKWCEHWCGKEIKTIDHQDPIWIRCLYRICNFKRIHLRCPHNLLKTLWFLPFSSLVNMIVFVINQSMTGTSESRVNYVIGYN